MAIDPEQERDNKVKFAGALVTEGFELVNTGDFAKAQPLLEQGLAICEKELGTEHPITAMAMAYLAKALEPQGEHAKARHLLEQALAIHRKTLG